MKSGGGGGREEFIPRHNIEFITELAKSASHPAYSIAGNNDGEQGLWEGRRGGEMVEAVNGGLIKLGDDRAKLETLNSILWSISRTRSSVKLFPFPDFPYPLYAEEIFDFQCCSPKFNSD